MAPCDSEGAHGATPPLLTLAKPRASRSQRSSPAGWRSHSLASHMATQNTKDNPSKSSHIPARDPLVPGSRAWTGAGEGTQESASAKAMASARRMSRASSKRYAERADDAH
ncbi:MAG: hypothetical protein H6Q86_2432 [candidate division NC10 bacterium]|nr:hypothetical protein [candidate division NC10 bacterium]